MNFHNNEGLWLLVVLAVLSLIGVARAVWAAGPGNDGQAATPLPWESPPAPSPGDQQLVNQLVIDQPDPAPTALAETFTDRLFWVVMALQVLGSIILMADFPDPN